MSSAEIRLTREDDWWVAEDVDTGVVSQGETHEAALENPDEAVALHRGEAGEPIESSEEERAMLEELGLDPDEIADARDRNDRPPGFMQ